MRGKCVYPFICQEQMLDLRSATLLFRSAVHRDLSSYLVNAHTGPDSRKVS
jgi:hypothetical protein